MVSVPWAIDTDHTAGGLTPSLGSLTPAAGADDRLVLMGSVAAAVARHADRPVMIVHPAADAHAS